MHMMSPDRSLAEQAQYSDLVFAKLTVPVRCRHTHVPSLVLYREICCPLQTFSRWLGSTDFIALRLNPSLLLADNLRNHITKIRTRR